ncbi:ribbon-helix-helix protein, CopG family [Catalinimonas sp. 4WD22]|uniref:ribbon-helix-helix protein, CopG family n=1 Tax=Catalinimonas locisalis TaxID=3133978 RepID=UPI0031015537
MAEEKNLIPRVVKIPSGDWDKLAKIAGLQQKNRPEVIRRAIKHYIGIAMPPKAEIMYSQLQKEISHE